MRKMFSMEHVYLAISVTAKERCWIDEVCYPEELQVWDRDTHLRVVGTDHAVGTMDGWDWLWRESGVSGTKSLGLSPEEIWYETSSNGERLGECGVAAKPVGVSVKEEGLGCMECVERSAKMMTRKCPLDLAMWRLRVMVGEGETVQGYRCMTDWSE